MVFHGFMEKRTNDYFGNLVAWYIVFLYRPLLYYFFSLVYPALIFFIQNFVPTNDEIFFTHMCFVNCFVIQF